MKYKDHTKEGLMLYNDLCKAVNKIDKEAFKYMVIEAIKQETFVPNNILSACFFWDDTPQGRDYWDNIETILENEGYYD